MRILITGAAGFIGFHFAKARLDRGDEVLGIDNLNEYYDVRLKQGRLQQLTAAKNFRFEPVDLADFARVSESFRDFHPDVVVNLAAQAGVRYSLDHPFTYARSNLDGFLSVLEACRHIKPRHLIFASSSSVYGANTKVPFSVHDNVDHPVSLYAATKKSNELMAHTYSHLFAIPSTGLRFFTVYGPWGRPDMAYFSFTRAILAGQPIELFNNGEMERDFTYITDIVAGMEGLLDKPPSPNPSWDPARPDPASSSAPYRLFNIGNHQPVKLRRFVEVLEEVIGKKAIIRLAPMQPGDVRATWADIEDLTAVTGFHPHTSIEEGLREFVAWFRHYYRI